MINKKKDDYVEDNVEIHINMWLIEDNVANVEIHLNGWSIEDVIKIYIAICSIEDNVEIHIPGVPKKFPFKSIYNWTQIHSYSQCLMRKIINVVAPDD